MGYSQNIKEAIENLDSQLEVEKQIIDVQIPNIEHPNLQKITDINLSIAQSRNSASVNPAGMYLPRRNKPTHLLPNSDLWGDQNHILCPNCNETLSSKVKFCDNCGQKIISTQTKSERNKFVLCSHCERKILVNSSYCMHCGHSLSIQHESIKGTSHDSQQWICNNCDQLNDESLNVCQWCDSGRR